MKQYFLFTGIFVLFFLGTSLVANPNHAHAQLAVAVVADTAPTTFLSLVKETVTSIATYAGYVKQYVLDPIAFVQSGNALRSITAGIIDFINGGNGTGNPLYVQNLSQHLLGVGDQQALVFFAELGHSNSPFGSMILNSLKMNYFGATSGAGFWGNNICTLNQYSQNPLAFIGGNFNQGGWPAWFALTTNPQNNPYLFYYRAQAELYSRTEKTVASTLTQLAWGDGFMSWCGDQTSQTVSAGGDVPDVAITSASNCTKDGKPGTIQTPASVIRDSLQKALGAPLDQLGKIGDPSTDFGSIFANLMKTLQVVAYGQQLLGGPGGLFGTSHPTGVNQASPLRQYIAQPSLTQADINSVNQNAATYRTNANQQSTQYGSTLGTGNQSGNGLGGSFGTGGGAPPPQAYIDAWNTIGNQATLTRDTVAQVQDTCQEPWATNASTALTNIVFPAMQAATRAPQDTPTQADVSSIQAEAQQTSAVIGGNCGAFNPSGGTLMDRLVNLQANAQNALNVCNSNNHIAALGACPP